MRSGGSVLKAPPGAEEGALPRERECKAAQCIPLPGAGTRSRRKYSCGAGAPSPVSPHPRSRHPIAAKVLMRSGGSVLEAPPGAEEGALPREHEHEAAYALASAS